MRPPTPGTSANNFFRVSIAGASQAMTRISVDGATINDRVTGGTSQNFSQESVQEFQISTFNFDLSTSVTSVGSVNIVSRSGSNELHGGAFILLSRSQRRRFSGLRTRAANRFSDPGLDDPFFARRQMGGSLGGPIKKDKLFWFFNFENNNQDGVFPVNNNHAIYSQFDHIAPNPLCAKQANAKFDWRVNEKHNAYIRLSTDNNDNYNPNGGVRMPSNWVVTKNVAAQIAQAASARSSRRAWSTTSATLTAFTAAASIIRLLTIAAIRCSVWGWAGRRSARAAVSASAPTTRRRKTASCALIN